MKTRYQFVHFEKIGGMDTKYIWSCRNNRSGDELGQVQWYNAWRQYCFEPSGPSVYSAGCLDDISHFIGQLQQERKIAAGTPAGQGER